MTQIKEIICLLCGGKMEFEFLGVNLGQDFSFWACQNSYKPIPGTSVNALTPLHRISFFDGDDLLNSRKTLEEIKVIMQETEKEVNLQLEYIRKRSVK